LPKAQGRPPHEAEAERKSFLICFYILRNVTRQIARAPMPCRLQRQRCVVRAARSPPPRNSLELQLQLWSAMGAHHDDLQTVAGRGSLSKWALWRPSTASVAIQGKLARCCQQRAPTLCTVICKSTSRATKQHSIGNHKSADTSQIAQPQAPVKGRKRCHLESNQLPLKSGGGPLWT
jgi:hypothetical protein